MGPDHDALVDAQGVAGADAGNTLHHHLHDLQGAAPALAWCQVWWRSGGLVTMMRPTVLTDTVRGGEGGGALLVGGLFFLLTRAPVWMPYPW